MAGKKETLTLEELRLPTPEIEEPVIISYDGESYLATGPGSVEVARDEDLVAIYDGLREKTQNLRFDPSLPEYDSEMEGTIFTPVDEQGTGRILIAVSDETRRACLEDGVEIFLEILDDYIENPSFYNSYRFIDFHPIFWRKAIAEDELPTWDWVTDDGIREVEQFIYEETPGNIVVSLEAGPTWVADETANDPYLNQSYHMTSHDYRLDAYGSTYEEAVIKLAKNIYKHYEINGTDRGLEYDDE